MARVALRFLLLSELTVCICRCLLKTYALSLGPLPVSRSTRVALLRVSHSLYSWEFFISIPFDYDVIRGRKAFKWPLVR